MLLKSKFIHFFFIFSQFIPYYYSFHFRYWIVRIVTGEEMKVEKEKAKNIVSDDDEEMRIFSQKKCKRIESSSDSTEEEAEQTNKIKKKKLAH